MPIRGKGRFTLTRVHPDGSGSVSDLWGGVLYSSPVLSCPALLLPPPCRGVGGFFSPAPNSLLWEPGGVVPAKRVMTSPTARGRPNRGPVTFRPPPLADRSHRGPVF